MVGAFALPHSDPRAMALAGWLLELGLMALALLDFMAEGGSVSALCALRLLDLVLFDLQCLSGTSQPCVARADHLELGFLFSQGRRAVEGATAICLFYVVFGWMLEGLAGFGLGGDADGAYFGGAAWGDVGRWGLAGRLDWLLAGKAYLGCFVVVWGLCFGVGFWFGLLDKALGSVFGLGFGGLFGL